MQEISTSSTSIQLEPIALDSMRPRSLEVERGYSNKPHMQIQLGGDLHVIRGVESLVWCAPIFLARLIRPSATNVRPTPEPRALAARQLADAALGKWPALPQTVRILLGRRIEQDTTYNFALTALCDDLLSFLPVQGVEHRCNRLTQSAPRRFRHGLGVGSISLERQGAHCRVVSFYRVTDRNFGLTLLELRRHGVHGSASRSCGMEPVDLRTLRYDAARVQTVMGHVVVAFDVVSVEWTL